jgi:GntR family transcriptional regulator
LWEQVHGDLLRRVDSGEFKSGFPGESALVSDYDVSRYTIREAVRRLRAEGLVTSRRSTPGRRPFPDRRPAAGGPGSSPPKATEDDQPLGTLYSLFTAVDSAGQEQRSLVRTLEVRTDGAVAQHLGLQESTPLVFLERLRLAGSKPLALDRVWLPAAVARPLLEVDFTRSALNAELHARCGVRLTRGQERIRAVVPTAAERVLLGMDDGIAALEVEQLGVAGTTPMEWRHTLVRGDRLAVSAQFPGRPTY